MRIVHVIPALTKGGAEKVLVDLANEAQRRGHAVSVVAGLPADPRLIRDRLDPAIALEIVGQRDSGKFTAYAALPVWLWRRRVLFDQADVVHCHLTYAAVLGTWLKWQRTLRGKTGPAIVETFHGVGMPIRARQRWLAATLARGRDGFALMAEDAFWTQFLQRHSDLPGAVIPNGLALDQSASVAAARAWRADQGIPVGAPVIGTIGRLRAERNPLATLAAFAEVARAMPQAHFIIGGDGPMTDAVRAEADRLSIGARLHLPGLVLDPLVVLANIDMYLSMNVGPITGIAGLEAAAAGVPMIAVQARADYARASGDWIWSDADPAKVGAELIRLMQSSAERAALAQRQQSHVAAQFSIAAAQVAYEALYVRAIAHARDQSSPSK